ncbi:MAG: glyoxalase [Candidatus Dormibacteraeota bacterium]|nr:glyoxalase [Candidatus Dormibacteraeota bacterium]
MNQGVKTVLYPVSDLAAAKALFTTLLGAEPMADAPYYVGWNIDGQDIGLVPSGPQQGLTGPLPYFQVSDIKGTLQELLAAGAQVMQDAKDVGGGKLVATVKDADGNLIGLAQNP